MITILSSEPEPQHDRPADVPESMPPLPQRDPGGTLRATAGLIEDLEREDDRRGFEDEPEARALGCLLLRLVRSANDACPLCGYWTCRCDGAFVASTTTLAVAR